MKCAIMSGSILMKEEPSLGFISTGESESSKEEVEEEFDNEIYTLTIRKQ